VAFEFKHILFQEFSVIFKLSLVKKKLYLVTLIECLGIWLLNMGLSARILGFL